MVDYAIQLVTRYDGMVIARFPDWPGISAIGRDDEEAIDEARRCLREALAAREAEARDPMPSIADALAGPVLA